MPWITPLDEARAPAMYQEHAPRLGHGAGPYSAQHDFEP
jgi:hypothetical protein